jgi:diguanylate cyclase (GGDEF)-like protein
VAEEVIHRDLSLLYAPEDVSAGKPAADLASAVRNGREESETWRLRKNGRRFWANIVTVALYNDDGSIRGFSRITRDMTDRKRAEEQLLHDALHDTLTGLPNRALFTDRLTQALAHATRRPDYRCAVLFLDIDRFKVINDTHTHEVGDELLIGFARRLVGCLRPGDTVARLGGDEFTILVDDIRSPDEASVVARRVQRALQAPLRIGGRELALSASVGIALSTRGMTAAELMRNADIAMYDAKRHGKSRSATFDTGMHTRVARELEVESKLRSAINSERLNIAYQPIVELATGRLQGFEALARWPMDEPAIPASEFIKVAEESGLIGELGTFILDRACVRLSDWRDRGLIPSDATMSVNVSRHQLDEPSLIQAVRTALARARLPANALCLEITETAMVHEPHGIQAAIARFTEIGVQAHIDDFGMGYSSLAFLRSFAGNAVKIDRSYIASIHSDETSEAIVRAILELARTLDVRSIAEGVEHEAQLEKLLDLGCESAQGFLFSRALLAQEVETLIRSWDHHVTMQALAQSRSQAARS